MLLVFSALTAVSGAALALFDSPVPILLACIVGNISTTGTEAGPFQSVEAGVLPDLVPEGKAGRAFGVYNFVGYTASALGALTLYVPGSESNNVGVFRLLFLGFSGVGVILFAIYAKLPGVRSEPPTPSEDLRGPGPDAKTDVTNLSALFSIDAFGGSFVSQYLLSYWLNLAFGIPNSTLGIIFFFTTFVSAASIYPASVLGERFGNLKTMVYTHVASNVFLLLVAISSTAFVAVFFLFIRQAFSQMDVPTRQALMVEMFRRDDRVPAYAVTNTVRSVGAFFGGPVTTALLGAGLAVGLLYFGGVSKLLYDGLVYRQYRNRFWKSNLKSGS
jgi:predicted MFS family arabinose efflux permease